jgi:hypothetical protein
MIQLPVMHRNDEAVTLGKDDPDKENHGNFNQIWPGKKGEHTQPYNYSYQRPNLEYIGVSL